MENGCVISRENGEIELPPGFRFHPTDEELITYYLSPKVIDSNFCAGAVGEVDLNKVEPWDLPWKAKMGEKEWYFFCVRDRKYPTGLRTNRATDAGYWKATGKDKEIHRAKALVGMKKTLVFYKGRAPKGEKTNWVMHEYRLEGKHTNSVYNLPKNKKNEWVISRIFKKGSGGKKMHISGLVRFSSYGTESKHFDLPPLLHLSSGYEYDRETKIAENSHVTCFSETVEDQKKPEEEIKIITPFASLSSFSAKTCDEISSCTPSLFSKASAPSNSFFANQIMPQIENILYPDSFLMQEQQSMLRLLLENNVSNVKPTCKAEFSLDTSGTGMSTDISSAVSNHQFQRAYVDLEYHHISTSASAGPLDSLWNY